MIGIIDYGMGNLYSVSKALERLGQEYILTKDPEELWKADGLILPGVGSFKDAMHILSESGLREFLIHAVEQGTPLLGICLGMQLLFTESEENGSTMGLDLLKGRVERFKGASDTGERYKVPHMGWNGLEFLRPNDPLLQGVNEDYVYFVHSYVVRATHPEDVIAASNYYGQVPSIVGRQNVYGAQFHPEKSGRLGMAVLKNYCIFVERKQANVAGSSEE